MESRNDHAKGIRCVKIEEKDIATAAAGPAPRHRKKRLIKTIILIAAIILSAVLAAHDLIRTEKTVLGPNDEYRIIHLFGTNFFLHNTGTGIPIFNLIDIEKDDIGKISRLTSFQKEYVVVTYAGGIKIYDRGKYVSEYKNESMMETISSFVADYDGNGNDDIFLLLKKKDEKYGERLIVVNYNGKKAEKTYDASFQKVNPWKVQVCDVDGDGKMEISLGVYTVAKYHQVYAKRPFLYYFYNNKLYPKWLGSRLSRPFDDYIFCDIDGDKMDELISAETTQDGKKELNAYKWTGFGFESIGVSKPYDKIYDIKTDGKLITVFCGDHNATEPKLFEYRNGKIETGG
jgi:hypothetical protein